MRIVSRTSMPGISMARISLARTSIARALHPLADQAALFTLGAVMLCLGGCKSKTPEVPLLDDGAMTTAAQQAIGGDSAISTEPIQVAVSHGVVTLTGAVSNDAARTLAGRDAATVPGVHSVVNDLTVQPAAISAVVPTTQVPEPTIERRPSAAIRNEPAPITRSERARQQRDNGADQQARDRQPPSQQSSTPIAENRPAPPPPAPPKPTFRDVTIPAGTTIAVRMTQTLDSATTQSGEAFSGAVASDIVVDDLVALPQGTTVNGKVDEVKEAAHFKGDSLLTIELTGLRRKGDTMPISTDQFSKQGKGRGKNTAEKVGGGAAVGAILGGIFGGGTGAAVGAAAGGGLGAGAQAITRGQQVQIPSETLVRFKLTSPITVRVAPGSGSRVPGADNPDLQHRNDQ